MDWREIKKMWWIGSLFDLLIGKVEEIAKKPSTTNEKLLAICKLLKDNVPHYDWVGFHLVDRSWKKELVLGPFVGEPTEHVRIPFGRGVCGRALERKAILVVQDVSREENYLSCSPKVKSEIVVPIFKNGEIVGELDIDSHVLSPFTEEDKIFLGKVCGVVSNLL